MYAKNITGQRAAHCYKIYNNVALWPHKKGSEQNMATTAGSHSMSLSRKVV
jgi:hypothetical protein